MLRCAESDRKILDRYLEIILDRYKMNEIDIDDVREEIIEAFTLASQDRAAAIDYMNSVMSRRNVD